MKNAMTALFKAIMVVAVVSGFVFAGSVYSERMISVTKGSLTGAKTSYVSTGSAKRIPLKGL